MRNSSSWFVAFILIVASSMMCIEAAHAFDDLPRPPPPPKGWVPPPKQTEDSVTQHVERQTTVRFVAAAGSSDALLSKQQAKNAGWGFVSDHFSEIDRNGSGYVSLADVLGFMAPRTPQRIMSQKAAAKAGGQITK